MDVVVNGAAPMALSPAQLPHEPQVNGIHHDHTIEQLEQELSMVLDDQIPLGELVSRVVQSIYAELVEHADTLPGTSSDQARKRILADWVVKTKKQVVKLYAIARWSRDADVVQKAMNITAFLMDQNKQFQDAIYGLNYAKESLDPARLRNHDLLTSLDVLTTGTYRRLPSAIKQLIIPPTPLTDEQVEKILADLEHSIRYRLRMDEIIPVEMVSYTVHDGRVFFTAPKLFEASLFLGGSQRDDGWFFANVRFLFTIGGDLTGIQDFPRQPTGMLNRHITDEANARLRYYTPNPPEFQPPPEAPQKPQLPPNTVDAPLVRVFNFLQFMSLAYQLEILCYQAERMRTLGWAEYLTVEMAPTRKSFKVSYWIRKQPPTMPGRPPPRVRLPPQGGTLTVSIVDAKDSSKPGSRPLGGLIGGPARCPNARILAEIQEKTKLQSEHRPSDDVESLKLEVKWEPSPGALGVALTAQESKLPADVATIDADSLDLEGLLRKVLDRHAYAILQSLQSQLKRSPTLSFGEARLDREAGVPGLRITLCADEVVVVNIDPRTGRLNLRDTGNLATAKRGPRFLKVSDQLNENPGILFNVLHGLRLTLITELVEHKANYLGLQFYRTRNFSREELAKLGPAARGTMYIQLLSFPSHYLVLVITDDDFRYALIHVAVLMETPLTTLVMEDIGWLNVRRIRGESEYLITEETSPLYPVPPLPRKKGNLDDDQEKNSGNFSLDNQLLRELYAYCCARVAYAKVERQFKLRGIPFMNVTPASPGTPVHLQSCLARSIPALCVQSSDILSGAPAAEAAMPNIRVIPLNWWSEKKVQVVTCVKLKYVQQPIGKKARTSNIIRPSKAIIYDTTEAVVSFLSEDVDKCVDEFLEEWANVSKMVVIAREVARMAKVRNWHDVRLLSFDLQTVEFAYASSYSVSITSIDQLSAMGGSYSLRFSRCDGHDGDNPHGDAEPFFRNLLRAGKLLLSLNRVVSVLRDTLPIVALLETFRSEAVARGCFLDSFPKAAAWYRLLYGDSRYALDFRLMTEQRIAILDASYSIFSPDTSTSRHKSPPNGPHANDNSVMLQPIPDFKKVVTEVVAGEPGSGVFSIDVGLICGVDAVKRVGKALHDRLVVGPATPSTSSENSVSG